MYSGTHVSLDGCLYKVLVTTLWKVPHTATFMGYGRLVHPKGSYAHAPYVSLYRSSDGYFAVIQEFKINVNEHIALGHAKYKADLIKSGYPKHMLADAPMMAREYVECKSGLKFSAQASSGHYCAPRQNDGPWALIEIGFPDRPVPEFGESGDDVYGWTPVEIVDAVIAANGGFAE